MKDSKLIIVLFCSIIWPVRCSPRRKKDDATQKFHRTGEAIALDYLIQKYEKAHQKFYEEEIKDGKYLEWPALNGKNLSNYCTNYVNLSVPTRTNGNVMTGTTSTRILHYGKGEARTTNEVIVLCCKVIYNSDRLIYYYLTRAPDPHCVYALKCKGSRIDLMFTIINEYCDFEGDLSNISQKRKRIEVFSTMHRRTSQPIAKDKYLLEYELEHQELLKKEGKEGKAIEWPHVKEHHNLDSYCYQYMKECAPSRDREGVIGNWKSEKLQYQKLHTSGDINVTTVGCKKYGSKRQYHMTRAWETNCVYALLRTSFNARSPLVIIFKHCDFENSHNHQVISQDYDIAKKCVIPKSEIKEEEIELETLQLLPKD